MALLLSLRGGDFVAVYEGGAACDAAAAAVAPVAADSDELSGCFATNHTSDKRCGLTRSTPCSDRIDAKSDRLQSISGPGAVWFALSAD